MVDFISSWAEQIILAVIIATILEMILPNNKSKKYIKTVIGIYILFIIISPFSNTNSVISSSEIDLEEYVYESEVDQTSMDKRLEELYLEELEKDIIKKVEEEGYEVKKCEVQANLLDEEEGGIKEINLQVTINSNNIEKVETIEINVKEDNQSNNEDVDDEKIKELKGVLSSYYEISEDIIFINNK